MAAINRFYRPSRGQYISQFVPDNLPADLMLQGLGMKQQKYDSVAASIAELGKWQQAALAGGDTEYRDQKKAELEQFINTTLNKDLGSPEFIREYQQFVTDFQSDEGLQKVQAAVDTHNEYLEALKRRREGKPTEFDPALIENYERNFTRYTEEGGLGFRGDTPLADPTILEGVDINKQLEAYFDQLKASGSESIADLDGIAYKKGWTGVSGKRISQQAANILDIAYKSRAGEQLQARYEMSVIPRDMTYQEFYSSLTPEQLQEFEGQKRQYVKDQLLAVGQGFTYGKSTTNMDVALRTQREELRLYPQPNEIEVAGNTQKVKTPSYGESMRRFEANNNAVEDLAIEMDEYQKILQFVESGKAVSREMLKDLGISDATLDNLRAVPGADQFLNGGQGSIAPELVNTLKAQLANKIQDNNALIGAINTEQESFEYHMHKSLQAMDPDRRFGDDDLLFTDALAAGERLKDSYGKWMEVFDATMTDPGGLRQVNEELIRKIADTPNGRKKEELKDLQAWTEAKMFQGTILRNPGLTKVMVDTYDATTSYQPIATTIPTTDTYMGVTYRNGVLVSDNRPSRYIDKDMEVQARNNTNMFAIMIGGRRVEPGDPMYPDPSTITFASANNTLFGGKPAFNGTATITKYVDDRTGRLDEEGNPKQVAEEEQINYTFVAEGYDTGSYLRHKSNEALASITKDPGYNPNKSIYNQNTLTEIGNVALRRFASYEDPSLVTDLNKMEQLSPGEKKVTMREVYNPYNGKREGLKYITQKDDDTGDLILSIKTVDGENFLPNLKEMRYGSVGEVGNAIIQLEMEMNQMEQDGVGEGRYTDAERDAETSAMEKEPIVPLEDDVERIGGYRVVH